MQKDNYWQFMRGIGIIFVIIIHCLYETTIISNNIFNIIVRCIINCSVPLFLFMAGYFIKIKDISSFYLKKIMRLIPSLLIWDLIYLIVFSIIAHNFDLKSIICSFMLSSHSAHLYYIYVLIQLFIISPLLFKILYTRFKYIPLLVSFIYNFFYVFLKVKYNFSIPFYNYWIFGWILYFYLGIVLRNNVIKLKKVKLIYLIIFYVLLLCESLLIYIYNNDFYFLSVSQLTLFNCLYCFGLLLYLFQNKTYLSNYFNNSLIINFGNYSFGIYLLHMFILFFVKRIFKLFKLNYYVYLLFVIAVTMILSYFLNKLYYKYKERKSYE